VCQMIPFNPARALSLLGHTANYPLQLGPVTMHGDSGRLTQTPGSESLRSVTISARVASLVALQDKKGFSADEGRCTEHRAWPIGRNQNQSKESRWCLWASVSGWISQQ
jgi:hypothetical protein